MKLICGESEDSPVSPKTHMVSVPFDDPEGSPPGRRPTRSVWFPGCSRVLPGFPIGVDEKVDHDRALDKLNH